MATLARYGHVQPSEFEQMLYVDAIRLSKRLEKMVAAEQKLQVELGTLNARAMGARVG